MNRDDAEEYTEALGQIAVGSWRQAALGDRLGVPAALGLTTREWVSDRLGGYVRLAVAERREAVAELTGGDEPLSNVKAAEVLGVDEGTVRNDRKAASESSEAVPERQSEPQVNATTPETTSEDSESAPLQQPTEAVADTSERDALAAGFVQMYPPLAYYADDPKQVIALGRQLDTFSVTELPARLDNLDKAIAADQRAAAAPPQPEVPDYYAMTGAMFDAVNAVAQAIDKQGGANTVAAAVGAASMAEVAMWADQFDRAITKLTALAEVCHPSLRRVK